MDKSPFLSSHHGVSPTLQFTRVMQDENEMSNLYLEGDYGDYSNATNNLRFYPSRQSPGLTRSIGRLNLSLENTGLFGAGSPSGDLLTRIKEENDDNSDGLLQSNVGGKHGGSNNAKKWVPFSPKLNKLRRSTPNHASRAPLMPIPQVVINKGEVSSSERWTDGSPFRNKKKIKKTHTAETSFDDAKPDQSAFQQRGLISKLHSNLFPKKLTIPDTPVKRTPQTSIMDAVEMPAYHSELDVDEDDLTEHSPHNGSGLSFLGGSPTHPPKPQRLGYDREPHLQQKKKRSKIIKNIELSNMLQEFTDDLFGNSDEGTLFGSSPVETPRKALRKERGSATSTSQCKYFGHKSKSIFQRNPDEHLTTRFSNVSMFGKGQFSVVYQVTFPETQMKYAIKSLTPKKHNLKSRILYEIQLLSEIGEETRDSEGKEYVIQFISSWEYEGSFYLMTELCENGNLDQFLQEQIVARSRRLEDWRIWKIIVELCLALRFIHDTCSIVHLDLKPANVMITFEGNLKLGDFGMATKLPLTDKHFENEGDREYIAPEIISDGIYDFKADIFSLGLMIVEIAANVVLPDNGNAWHKLRSGDLSDAGRLSSTEIHSNSIFSSTHMNTQLTGFSNHDSYSIGNSVKGLVPAWVPRFLIDKDSLERMVMWMIEPDYRKRPSAADILQTEECQYVELTRKAGAIIQEDDFGPKPEFFT